jgi:hypothetical protein
MALLTDIKISRGPPTLRTYWESGGRWISPDDDAQVSSGEIVYPRVDGQLITKNTSYAQRPTSPEGV